MRSRRATVLFATLVAAFGAGVGDAVDARRGEVVEAFVDVNDPVGDVVEPTTDITRAYVELDGGLFVSLRTDQFSGFPGDDFDWWGNNRSVTWHLDTDFDGADDYRVVYTGRPAFPGVVDAAEYDVVNASGEVTCTGSWIIFFGEPWPLDGIHAEVQGECIGNPAALQWFVEYRYQTGAKYEYIDRAPNTGWSGPVTNSNPPPTVPDVPPVPPTGPITPVPPRRVFDSRPAGVLPIGVHRIRIAGRGGVPVDASACS